MQANFVTHEERKENNSLSLWISEERSWDVNFSFNSTRRQVMLNSGWSEFIKDNNLKVGNVCVFERIKKSGISFRVIIFRDPKESSPSNFSGNSITNPIICFNIQNVFLVVFYEEACDNDGADANKQTGLQNTSASDTSDSHTSASSDSSADSDSDEIPKSYHSGNIFYGTLIYFLMSFFSIACVFLP